MSDAGAADEWDVVVPDNGDELVAELRRHGAQPGQRLRVRSSPSSGTLRSANTSRSKSEASKTAGRWASTKADVSGARK